MKTYQITLTEEERDTLLFTLGIAQGWMLNSKNEEDQTFITSRIRPLLVRTLQAMDMTAIPVMPDPVATPGVGVATEEVLKRMEEDAAIEREKYKMQRQTGFGTAGENF